MLIASKHISEITEFTELSVEVINDLINELKNSH